MTAAIATAPPATTPASATQTNLASGQASLNQSYSTFLTLLTTQLKNQDPTAPLDTNAFTQQLVAMTGVQQQLLSNQLLQTIATNGSSGGSVSSAVGLIGKTVTATSADATLSGGAANWSYTLGGDASVATLTVSDSTGKAVWSNSAANLAAGAHTLNWNGKDFSGLQLPDGGTYTLSIAASDSAGNPVASTTSVTGQVGSVTEANGTTMVKIGPTAVPLASITAVTG